MNTASHMAGIIPVANLQTDLETPFEPVLTLVAPGYTAIQKSVLECAIAGCRTIWIVCGDDTAPIIRQIVGEWIFDPVYLSRPHVRFPSEHQREIPIYYVPIHPKDMDRRDSYGWSALYGIASAWRVASKISRWLLPDKYFISFPLGLHNVYGLRPLRQQISSTEGNFFLSHKEQTVLDNLPLSFTMSGDDFLQCRRQVNSLTTKEYYNTDEQYPSEKLPLSERWSARHFDFATVFGPTDRTNAVDHEVDWYYDASQWEEYRNYLGSENFIKKPAKILTQPRRHAKLTYTQEGSVEEIED